MTSIDPDAPRDLQEVVHVTLPGCPDCDRAGDSIPAIRTSGDCYRIVQVPSDSAALGVGDLVLALPVDGTLEFAWVLERRCLASCSFRLPGWVPRGPFFERLDDIGVVHREVDPNLFMCNVDSESAVHELVDLLAQHRIDAQLCDHVTGHWHQTS